MAKREEHGNNINRHAEGKAASFPSLALSGVEGSRVEFFAFGGSRLKIEAILAIASFRFNNTHGPSRCLGRFLSSGIEPFVGIGHARSLQRQTATIRLNLRQRRVVIGFRANFRYQFGVDHDALFVEDHDRAGD